MLTTDRLEANGPWRNSRLRGFLPPLLILNRVSSVEMAGPENSVLQQLQFKRLLLPAIIFITGVSSA